MGKTCESGIFPFGFAGAAAPASADVESLEMTGRCLHIM
jgi:hypothetical protein